MRGSKLCRVGFFCHMLLTGTVQPGIEVWAIGSGQAGGPMAAVGPLVSTFAGAEAKAIRIERSGMRRSVSIPGVLDIVFNPSGARRDATAAASVCIGR